MSTVPVDYENEIVYCFPYSSSTAGSHVDLYEPPPFLARESALLCICLCPGLSSRNGK